MSDLRIKIWKWRQSGKEHGLMKTEMGKISTEVHMYVHNYIHHIKHGAGV